MDEVLNRLLVYQEKMRALLVTVTCALMCGM